MVFSLQRDMEAWANDLLESQERRYEREHKARCEAERERDEERRLYRERQKKLFVSILKSKFGAEPNLPENWADGRSSDDLDALTVKISECATLQDALAALR